MTQPLHVLLVDSHHGEPDSLEPRLKRTGYRTTLAPDRQRALETARRDPPDLILLDEGAANTSELDGAATCTELKRILPELPVLLYTRREAANANALSCGADGVVTRPADPALVMQKIVQLLGR